MHLRTRDLLTFVPVAVAVVVLKAAPAAGPATFVPHDIDANYRGGYAVLTADVNKDGKVDVIASSLSVETA